MLSQATDKYIGDEDAYGNTIKELAVFVSTNDNGKKLLELENERVMYALDSSFEESLHDAANSDIVVPAAERAWENLTNYLTTDVNSFINKEFPYGYSVMPVVESIIPNHRLETAIDNIEYEMKLFEEGGEIYEDILFHQDKIEKALDHYWQKVAQ